MYELVCKYDGIFVGRTSEGFEIRCNGRISVTECRRPFLKSDFVKRVVEYNYGNRFYVEGDLVIMDKQKNVYLSWAFSFVITQLQHGSLKKNTEI